MSTKYLNEDGLLFFWQQIKKVLNENKYTLPIATGTVVGGVKSGKDITVASDGSVSVNNANKVNNLTVLKAVPANAIFTDTTYTGATGSADGLLSKENYSKLSDMESGAEVNIIESIKVNNVALIPAGRIVSLTVATKTSQLTNDSDFQTKTQVDTAIAAEVGKITSFEFQIVTTLPATGVKGVIYLVPQVPGDTVYHEYIWVGNKMESIGSTSIDLSQYLKKTDLVAITNTEIDAIIAG